LICLVTLIINIYGLKVEISTIKKFTSGRGWGMMHSLGSISAIASEKNIFLYFPHMVLC
jgi:hypothetical protein